VVGVDHYPRFRSLQGAVADATRFHAWLCDADGGDLALQHSRLVLSKPNTRSSRSHWTEWFCPGAG